MNPVLGRHVKSTSVWMSLPQAARLEVVRNKQLYPYSCDGSSWQRPPHATYESLMAPQVDNQ